MMKSSSLVAPFGFSTFCDDIRYELNNKYSLMGIYRTDLFPLGAFPYILTKLCVELNFFQRRDEGLEDLVFSIQQNTGGNKRIIWEKRVSKSEMEKAPVSVPEEVNEEPRIAIHIPVEFPQLLLEGPGKISVFADKGKQRFRMGFLTVVAHP